MRFGDTAELGERRPKRIGRRQDCSLQVVLTLAAAVLVSWSARLDAQNEFPLHPGGTCISSYGGPTGIVAGPDGALWFAELDGSIGRITTTGVITEFAAPSSGYLFDIAVGSDGNLWFTEYDANKIGQITTSGVVEEFTIPTGASYPYGITSGADGNLWFTENFGNKIGRITTSGSITEFPLPSSGAMPEGIDTGPDGNVWFAEHQVGKIGRITPTGTITEYLLGGDGLRTPLYITNGPDDALWFTTDHSTCSSCGNDAGIGRMTTAGAVTNFFPLGAGSSPYGIVTGPDGNLWFTDIFVNEIGRMTTAGAVAAFPVPTPGSEPFGITAGPDGNLWFTEFHGSKIGRITTNGFIPVTTISAPLNVCPNSTGNGASVPDAGPGATYSWSATNGTITAGGTTHAATFSTGSVSPVILNVTVTNGAGSATGSSPVPLSPFCPAFAEFPVPPYSAPNRIAAGPDGNLWFTDTNNSDPKVSRITTAGVITQFPLPADNSIPLGLAAGPDGNLWYTRTIICAPTCGHDSIGRITTNGVVTEYSLAGFMGGSPYGIVAGPDGNLWFADYSSPFLTPGIIGRITPTGTITEFPTLTDNSGNSGITVGADGALWFTEYGANQVGRMTTSGAVTEFPIPTPDSGVQEIAGGPDGALWFTELLTSRIGRITTSGQVNEFALPSSDRTPLGIAAGPDGNVWFVEPEFCFSASEPPGIGLVSQITPVGGITDFEIPTPSSGPWGITLGPDGRLWFTESYAGKIGRISVLNSRPSVGSITPSVGSTLGGNLVTITGSQFAAGAEVWIGGVEASSVHVLNATQLTAVTGAHDPGSADVVVTDPDSSSGVLPGGFTYMTFSSPPTVSSITPSSGPSNGATAVTINGSNFQNGATPTIGGSLATGVSVVGPTQINGSTPPLSPGGLDDVVVINPDFSTGILHGGFLADFLDVPQGDIFHDYVEKIFRNGITAGCGGGNYCRNNPVRRDQMAVFLLKSEHGSTYVPPACTGVFPDVPCPGTFADWIERLAAEGITGGCGGGNYCPTNPVTRQQMAVFLLKTEHGSAFVPPACAGIFGDVPCPSLFADWIEQLYAEEVTGGCSTNPLLYCPTNSVTRGQMAVFLVKTFALQFAPTLPRASRVEPKHQSSFFPAAFTNFDSFPVGTTLASLTVPGMTFSSTHVDASVQDASSFTIVDPQNPIRFSGKVLAWTQSLAQNISTFPTAWLRIDAPSGSPCVGFDFAARVGVDNGLTALYPVYLAYGTYRAGSFQYFGDALVQDFSVLPTTPAVGQYFQRRVEFCAPAYLEYVELFACCIVTPGVQAGEEFLIDNLEFGIGTVDRLNVERVPSDRPSPRAIPPR